MPILINNKYWRYIRYSDDQEELYDHHRAPYKWRNLAKEPNKKAIKKQLLKEMTEIVGTEF